MSHQASARLPPGPRRLPIIGNLLDIPAEYPWKTFREWGQRWGEHSSLVSSTGPRSSPYIGGIVSLDMFGKPMIIVNSLQVANDLLERRSAIYSERPPMVSSEMIGYNNTFPLLTYGDRLKEQRRTAGQAIGTRALVEKFGPLTEREAHLFLSNLLKYPEHFFAHIKRYTGAVMLLIAYGYQVKSDGEDHVLEDSFELIEDFAESIMPGAFLVDTLATIKTFFLAMTLHPGVQAKAQAEVDAVVGSDRLPTLQDRNQLPYVNAICAELLRWLPAVPLGVPHTLREDDEYNGYFFPKGTTFMVNGWALLYDPERYHEPSEFRPERFLKTPTHEPEEDPHNIAFGFGRRPFLTIVIFTGEHVADATIFIAVASVLATFNITKKVKNGQTITPAIAPSSATIRRVKRFTHCAKSTHLVGISQQAPFECSIKPRSANAETLIRVTNESHDPNAVLA
ncbi:hypothetical protein EIP86_004528 [Pleurotus ostreatoroseus]|nr:hypothetical protein EIP86_004528 [Pleurotus ostreatoroseus]